jgi:hypothetical protein
MLHGEHKIEVSHSSLGEGWDWTMRRYFEGVYAMGQRSRERQVVPGDLRCKSRSPLTAGSIPLPESGDFS